ncbi:unnamed protein product [[Actinomadura] parvosata subsp. kistnae]|nr:unnamed protein product [Actinomadura parvosata subsp. kistnae]
MPVSRGLSWATHGNVLCGRSPRPHGTRIVLRPLGGSGRARREAAWTPTAGQPPFAGAPA